MKYKKPTKSIRENPEFLGRTSGDYLCITILLLMVIVWDSSLWNPVGLDSYVFKDKH